MRFGTQLTDIDIRDGQVRGVYTKRSSEPEQEADYLEAEVLVLAIGHSARDTFAMLKSNGPSPWSGKPLRLACGLSIPRK